MLKKGEQTEPNHYLFGKGNQDSNHKINAQGLDKDSLNQNKYTKCPRFPLEESVHSDRAPNHGVATRFEAVILFPWNKLAKKKRTIPIYGLCFEQSRPPKKPGIAF